MFLFSLFLKIENKYNRWNSLEHYFLVILIFQCDQIFLFYNLSLRTNETPFITVLRHADNKSYRFHVYYRSIDQAAFFRYGSIDRYILISFKFTTIKYNKIKRKIQNNENTEFKDKGHF